jgi:hypothetical protein
MEPNGEEDDDYSDQDEQKDMYEDGQDHGEQESSPEGNNNHHSDLDAEIGHDHMDDDEVLDKDHIVNIETAKKTGQSLDAQEEDPILVINHQNDPNANRPMTKQIKNRQMADQIG